MGKKPNYQLLAEIPVYPDYIKLSYIERSFPADAPLCEEKGRVSYISQEAKEKYIKSYSWRRKA